jgi:hypothetical protein
MKNYRIKITEQDFNRLQNLVLSDMPKEAGAFALAGIAEHDQCTDIIVRRLIEIPKELFVIQQELRFEVSSQAINGLIAFCESNGLGGILCHSHPYDIPYSTSDDYGERRVFETLRQFLPINVPTTSLLFWPGGVRGRVWLPHAKPEPITEILVVGRQVRRIKPDSLNTEDEFDEEIFDRQVRAFGKRGQAMIGQAKVGIVGLGGTGSPTAEQLARLGTRDMVLIDPDEFKASNITRMFGTFSSFFHTHWWPVFKKSWKKVDLLQAHLKKINPEIKIQAIPKNVVLTDVAARLLDRDFIFLCTDDHWGRSIVNQIAYQYLIPTINLGMHIASDEKDGKISDGAGVVDVLRPDLPCLWCRQYLRADRIAAESMPKNARQSREREGYVENIQTPTPSVVSITTTLSGMAVTLFLQLVTDFMGSNGDIARLNYQILEGTVRRGRATIPKECVCKKVKGFGNLKTLPTLTDIAFLEK